MKTLSFVLLSFFFLSGQATPLGDREVLRRHNGVALSRRHILQSRMDAPPACAAIVPTPPPAAVSASTDPTLSTGAPASRRHESDVSFSSEEEISSTFVESVTTIVSSWESLCISSGLDFSFYQSCLDLGGFNTVEALLETADPCDQQVIADNMITFAKSHGVRNRGDLINFALGYRRHARHAVRIFDILPSSLYCLSAPTNTELVGVYNEQFEGCNPGIFGSSSSALVPFGSDGTCPYGMSADVSTCGCTGGDDSTTSDDVTGSDDSSDSTDGTDDSSDSTDDSSDSTDDSTDSTGDSTDSSDSTGSSDSSDDSTTSTAPADDSTDTSSTDASSATDAASSDASSATTAASSDSSVATATATSTTIPAAAFVTPTDTTGPNVQPTDISGNVNDPEGR